MSVLKLENVGYRYSDAPKDVYVFKKSEELSKCILDYIERTKKDGISITANHKS